VVVDGGAWKARAYWMVGWLLWGLDHDVVCMAVPVHDRGDEMVVHGYGWKARAYWMVGWLLWGLDHDVVCVAVPVHDRGEVVGGAWQ
jgi:hypothetical protein